MPSLTIDVTPEQAARIQSAIGRDIGAIDELGENRDANAVEVRQWIIEQLKKAVRKQEVDAALAAVRDGVATLDVADAV